MKKGLQPTVFIGVLALVLTLMVLESDIRDQKKPTTVSQK
jgi:hypothetical protein